MPQQKTVEHDFGSTMRVVGDIVEADKEDELSHFPEGKQQAWVGVAKVFYLNINSGEWKELEENTDIAGIMERLKDLETENNQVKTENTKLKRRLALQIGEIENDAKRTSDQ